MSEKGVNSLTSGLSGARSLNDLHVDSKSILSVRSNKSSSHDNRSVKSVTIMDAVSVKSVNKAGGTGVVTKSVKSNKFECNKSIKSYKSDSKLHELKDGKQRPVSVSGSVSNVSIHSDLMMDSVSQRGEENNNLDVNNADGIRRGRKTRRDKDLIAMIQLSYRYLYKTCKLQVIIKKCWDIVPKGRGWDRVDPYVKVYLMPDKSRSGKRKSQILRDTFDPVFEKKLEFDIQKAELENRALYISLWHNNLFGHNVFLGELTIPLDSQLTVVRPKTYELRKKPNLLGEEFVSDEEDEEEVLEEAIHENDIIDVPAESLNVADNDGDAETPPYSKQEALLDIPQEALPGTEPVTRDDVTRTTSKRSTNRSVASHKPAPTKHKAVVNPLLKAVLYTGDVLLGIKFVPENDVVVVWDRDLTSKGEVHLSIRRGMNLPGYGPKGETNAFCKLRVMKNGKVLLKHKTKMIKGDSNPAWEARRRFENVGKDDITDTSIEISVWNKIRLTSMMIGKATLAITGAAYDWTRAKCLSDNTLYLEELVGQANQWVELLIPLRPNTEDEPP